MALQVWLPLNGNLDNQGLDDVTIVANNSSYQNDGKIGKCLKLGYTNSFTIPSMVGAKQMTIAYWCRVNTATETDWLDPIHFYSTDGNETYVSRQEFYTNCKNTGFWYKGGAIYVNSSPIVVGEWNHFAFTFNYTTGETSFYLNGSLFQTKTDLDTTHYITGINFRLGENGLDVSENDVRIYDHVLSPREVAELAKGLVCHYPLNHEGFGQNNLLINTADLTKWGKESGISVEWDDSVQMYKVTDSSHTSSRWGIYQDFACEPSTTYTFSVTGKKSDNSVNMGVQSFESTVSWSANVASFSENPERKSYTITTGANHTKIRIYLNMNPTTTASNTAYYLLPKLELGSVSTPWSPNSADVEYAAMGANGNVIYDTSGFGYNGTTNGTLTVSSNTARYDVSTAFNGVDNSIKIPFNAMLGSSPTDYTVSVWTYKTVIGTKNYQTILGGPTGFELEARSSSSTSPLYRIHNWGGGTTPYNFNEWTLFTFVRTTSDSKLYVNGELKITGTTGTVPTGNYYIGAWNTPTSQNFEGQMSDFRIYATALTADQVKQLYEAPISLADNGTLFANEFNET